MASTKEDSSGVIPGVEPLGAEGMHSQRRAGIHIPPSSNDAIGLIFRVGGISAMVAAWLCWQMRKRKKAALELDSL